MAYEDVYIGIGTGAILTNALIIAVTLNSRHFFRKSAFIFGLAVGNMVNGLAHLNSGAYRLQLTVSYPNATPPGMTQMQCMLTFGPTLFLLGTQLPAVLLIAIGIERFAAVASPTYFYHHWSHRKNWIVVCGAFLYVTASVGSGWIVVARQNTSLTISASCVTPSVLSTTYVIYNYGISIVGGTIGCLLTVAGLTAGRCRLNNASILRNIDSRTKKQLQLTRATLSITICDLGFVVAPNICLLLVTALKVPIKLEGAQSSIMYCCNSMQIIISYLTFNAEFRRRFFKMFGYNRYLAHSQIHEKTTGKR